MRSTTKQFACSFLFVVLAVPTAMAANPETLGIPAGAQLEKYPLQPGPLSSHLKASLGLHVTELTVPWVGFNHYRNLRGGKWVLDPLPAGTLVLVDANNVPIYKVDCGNRLVGIVKCPTCPTIDVDGGENVNKANTRLSVVSPNSRDADLFDRYPSFQKFVEWATMLGLGLLAWLFPLLLFLLLAYCLYRLMRWVEEELERRRHQRSQPPPPARSAPVQPEPIPAPAAPPVQPNPTQAPAAAPGSAQAPSPNPVESAPTSGDGYLSVYHGPDGRMEKVKYGNHRQLHFMRHGDGSHSIHFARS
jgi:hypothetical protein